MIRTTLYCAAGAALVAAAAAVAVAGKEEPKPAVTYAKSWAADLLAKTKV